MLFKKATLLLTLSVFATVVTAQKSDLRLEDIWGSPNYFARQIPGFRSMNDGEHYTQTVETEAGLSIVRYNFKSGKATDTLFFSPTFLSGTSDSVPPLEDYQFSPDEKKILFSAGEESIYRHSSRAYYYVYDRDSKKLSRVPSDGKIMYCRFSPKADKLAWVTNNNLFVHELSSSKTRQITHDGEWNKIINGAVDWVYEEEFGMDIGYSWNVDGSRLAYYRFDESAVKEFTLLNYGELYPKESRYKYPKAGEVNSKVSVFMYDLANDVSVKAKTDPSWEYIPRIHWTRDPRKLSIQCMNRHQNSLALQLADAITGEVSNLLKENNQSFIEVTDNLKFLNDGKRFIWTSSRDGYNHIYLYSMDGTLIKQVSSGKYDVTNFYGYDEKNQTFYFQSTEKSPRERQVWSIDSKGNKKLLTPAKGTHNVEFSSGFRYFADTWSTFGTPYRCALYDAKLKELRVLEDNKGVNEKLSKINLGASEELRLKTRDGVWLNGWIIRPPSYRPDRKYPVLIHVYGGPGVQTVTDDWDGPNYMWHQLLAQKGYIIVSVDNRGTPGRGLEFANCIYKDMGKLELDDQMDLVSWLQEQPEVDPSRIGVWGWSFGGYMTSLMMTKGGGKLRCGIAVAPVTNWKFYDTIYTERYLQTPQENPNGYEDNSPINFAKDLQGKFLLVHGSADDNVHYQNSMEFINALVKAKKPFDMMIYPNRNHGIYGGSTRFHLYDKMTNFILSNL